MSELRSVIRWGLSPAVTTAIVLAAASADAQQGPIDLKALAARTSARFNASAQHLADLSRRADSLERARRIVDNPETVRVGQIVAHVGGNIRTPSDVAAVGSALAEAWDEMTASLGNSAATVASGAELHWRRDSLNFRRLGSRSQVILSLGERGASQWLNPDTDHSEAVQTVLALYGDRATGMLPTRIRVWTGGWAPTIRPTPEMWERVAVLLATSKSSRARDCYTGVIGECVAVLSLAPPSDGDWWRVWYRQADLPAAVEDWDPKDPADIALARACTHRREAAACALAITRFAPRSPVPSLAVNTLLALALERGGPDAFARLRSAGESRTDALRETSGVDATALVSEWRARVYASRPPSPTPTLAEAGAMAFWAVAFGVLATRRRP